MAHYVINPSGETDALRFMHRSDLYQWADEIGLDYPKDAPAEVMKPLIRAQDRIPPLERFKPIHDSMGNVIDWKYKRLPATEAPRSKHADAAEAETRKVLATRRAELEAMNERQLTRRVKDQFGSKILERDLSRDDMIALFVGESEEGDGGPVLKGGITKTLDAPFSEEPKQENFPDWLLDSLTPMQLVKICRQYGMKANIKEGKVALLEKVRGHAA